MTDENRKHSAQKRAEEEWEEELNIFGIFHSIWKTRELVITVMVLSFLGLIGILAFSKLSIPTTENYRKAVQFTFSGLDKQEYPNERKFAISDLRAPIILQEVYRKNKLQNYGLDLKEFISSITVYPYSLGYAAVLQRYRFQLANKKLGFQERKQIEGNMAAELEQHQGRSAIIDMMVRKRTGFSKSLADKVLNDIVKVWAQINIEKYGVLKIPGGVEISDVVNLKKLKNLDIATIAIHLTEANTRIKARLEGLRLIDGAITLVDSKTGQGIDTVLYNVSNFGNYDLQEILTSALEQSDKPSLEKLKKILINRKNMIDIKKQGNAAKALSLKQRLAEYTGSQDLEIRKNPDGPAASQSNQGTAVSQISGGFIRQILALSEQKMEVEFRQDLVKKQLEFQNKEVDQDVEISFLTAFISLIDSYLEKPSFDNDDNVGASDLQSKISQAVQNLNENWKTMGRFYEMLGIKHLSYDGELYSSLELSAAQRFSSYHPLKSSKTWFFVFAAVVVFGILAMFAGLFLQIIRGH